MSKHHKHNKPAPFTETQEFQQSTPSQQTSRSQQKATSKEQERVDMTPGRDPAEGPDVAISSPSHERWAEGTAERDPTEGSDLEQ